MAVRREIRYDLTAADHLTGPMTTAARATDRAASAMDAASRNARVLDRALASQRKATDAAAGASLALARADEILKEAEHGLADGALEAEFALKKQAEASQKAGRDAAESAAMFSSLAGRGSGGLSGMGAVIAAGAALSPVIATLGVGLGGVALAAAGVAAPIEKAAQKTGGLRANMKLLDPEQRAVATSLLGLGRQYDAFQQALKPEVLGVFNSGITIAGHLLHDIQPVAQATGKAFSSFLGQLDKTFQGGQFQQFFAFMARTAAPDMKLLGSVLIDVVNDLPQLLEQLQPVAEGMLRAADGVLRLVGAAEKARLVLPVLGAIIGFQVAGPLGALAGALAGAGIELAAMDDRAQQFRPHFEQLGGTVYQVTPAIARGGGAAHLAGQQMREAGDSAGAAGPKIAGMGAAAGGAAQKVQSLEQQVSGLTAAENKALTPLLAYTNAVLTQKNDASSLAAALKKSNDQVGLGTAAQRASFSAANTYIQDLLNTAAAAQKSHQGIGAQITSIQQALPLLQNVKGGTKEYWQEVQTLVGWLRQLQQMKLISEKVHITGDGQWAFVQGGGANMRLHGQAARGLYISAGRPGVDDQLILAQRDELVVPPHLVRAGLVDHLRGLIPGFAQGGIVGSYAGPLGGLQPWGAANWQATVTQIAEAIARAMAAQVKAAVQAASSGAPGSMGGPVSAGAAQAQAYARSRLGAFGWGAAQMKFLIELWNRESGWNRLARNPGSGAYGIPQALPASKMGAAANPPTSSAAAQINWGLPYIKGRYGSPQGAWAHELSYNWYGGGLDAVITRPTLIGVGERGPEHVTVTPGSGDDVIKVLLERIHRAIGQLTDVAAAIPARTGRHVAAGVNGAAADAVFRGRYPGR